MEPLNLNYLLLIWGNLLAFTLTLTNIIKQFLIWIIFALTWKKWKIMFILCSSLPSRLVAFPLGRWYSAFWPVNRKHKWGEAKVRCCSMMGPWRFGSLSPRSCLCWAHSRPVAMTRPPHKLLCHVWSLRSGSDLWPCPQSIKHRKWHILSPVGHFEMQFAQSE